MPTETWYPSRAVRYGVLGGVLWVIALILYGLVRYPSAFTLSPVASIVYLALCAVLLAGYSWLAMQRTQGTTSTLGFTLRWGGGLGLLLGLCWLIELWAGNIADPSANAIVLLAYRGSILAVPLLIILTTFAAVRHTHLRETGIWVGIWSGIISGVIAFSGLMIIAYQGTFIHDPETIRQALNSGATDIMAYSVADSLVGAINHLWIGSLLGILFGAFGSFIGNLGNQTRPSAI